MRIPLFKIHSDDKDVNAVKEVIERGTFWADGPEIVEFEEKLASYVGQEHAIAFNNGTSALHALMLAYGIGPGDEVIVPSFTFISTANAPLFTGARPVFADMEPDTFGLDPEDTAEKITDKTKAIMPVHYGGHPCQIGALRDLAADRGLLLLEDAAEALGAKSSGKMVGTFSDAAMFSFCQNKIISTGEGGAITTDDEGIARKLRLLRSHGRATKGYFTDTGTPDYTHLGYNFRMPTMSAALGISQLAKIERLIDMRRDIAAAYTEVLAPLPGISPPKEVEGCRHVYQLYSVLLENRGMRDGLKKQLASAGIMSKVYFDPVHLSKHYYRIYGDMSGSLPVTEDIANRVLTLPLYPDMLESEVNIIINAIKDYLGE